MGARHIGGSQRGPLALASRCRFRPTTQQRHSLGWADRRHAPSAATPLPKKAVTRNRLIRRDAMTELTPPSLLTGTAATPVAAAAPGSFAPARGGTARGAAPPAGTQAPGWYRYKVGSFEITVVTDGVNRFKFPDNIVANAKREDVNAALAAAHLQPDIFVSP